MTHIPGALARNDAEHVEHRLHICFTLPFHTHAAYTHLACPLPHRNLFKLTVAHPVPQELNELKNNQLQEAQLISNWFSFQVGRDWLFTGAVPCAQVALALASTCPAVLASCLAHPPAVSPLPKGTCVHQRRCPAQRSFTGPHCFPSRHPVMCHSYLPAVYPARVQDPPGAG